MNLELVPNPEDHPPLAELIFDALDVGAAALDEQGRYIAHNTRWADLLGLEDAHDLVGQSHFDVCQSFLSKSDLATIAAGHAVRDQLVDLGGKGDVANVVRWNAAPIDSDAISCIVIIRHFDQSEVETSRLLRERDQLRFAVDGADYGLWDWDVTSGEVYFSQRYMNMLGYEQFELPHAFDTWEMLCKPEDLVPAKQIVEDYLSVGDGFYESEFQMRRKDGSFIWILSRGKIVSRLPDGSPLRIVGTHQDISVQKAREAQLVAARDEADKANQAKSSFLALISHEVRTPLNGITSVLKLLGDEPDPEERKRLSQIALNSSDQLLTVLSDVLDVSKMEAGRFDLSPRPIRVSDLLEELSQTHRKATAAKGLAFSTAITGDSELALMLDPVRVTQILNNFLSNATKFTEKGEIALSVDIDESYSGEKAGKVFVSFAVRDDGMGLTPSERGKLFLPFYQAETTRSRSSQGTGLGLSICKSLASLMGGKVWCASKKGYGSTFYFEAAFERAALDSAQSAVDLEEGSVLNRSDVRVLAAEDNPVNQLMLKKFLVDRFGYQVTTASNGREALNMVAKQSFDIILMDIHMPEMDGVEAARKIRNSSHEWCDTPMIALTADATDAHVEEYRTVGMNDCVAKPINWDQLDQKIQVLCSATGR